MSDGDTLCALDAIPDGGARGFDVEVGGESIRVILARRGARVFGYRNRCPHRGTPLDWVPDHFMDRSGEHLVCATHGALFRPEDGTCIAGPCAGDQLGAFPVDVRDGNVVRRES